MSSISKEQRKTIEISVRKIAKKHKVVGTCLYGSRVAGYARPESDYDLIIVLEDYAYILKYVYLKEAELELSALVVDRNSLERDAESAFLGEFVVGRLLHIYETITNAELFRRLEIVYKKRVILEEISDIVRSTNILSTEITFPLEYIMFSKIRHRSLLYRNALYSFYKTYTGQNSVHNIEFALNGYQQALKEILEVDNEMLILRSRGNLVQISEKRVDVKRSMSVASLKLTKKFQEFTSYIIHAYAGRHTLQYVVKEAEAKITRRKKYSIELPKFISTPRECYWKLPEGLLIIDDTDWLDTIANSNGFSRYVISNRFRLGKSTSVVHTMSDPDDDSRKKTIVVKKLAKSKAIGWSSSARNYKVDPLFRLSIEYKALRYIRLLGLNSPVIESVVLGKKILVTEFIEGILISDIMKNCLNRNTIDGLGWIKVAGEKIGIIHADKSTLGDINPSSLIIRKGTLYITGAEQFGFRSGDPVWDIVSFIGRGLKRTSNSIIAKQIVKEFLAGYSEEMTMEYMKKLINTKHYLELFYPLLTPTVAQTVKKEISNFVAN
ncbi:MAG: nucleotidyltransferase domain-containing protein [Nitrososphaeraceae archaeon]|jgi:tRNA A-37 threonylcarbamoyl transferase component Bud32/predicted nucleotidyltransferase